MIGIVRTSCSCADPAGQHGKCKHSVGLLLWCKNEENVSPTLQRVLLLVTLSFN